MKHKTIEDFTNIFHKCESTCEKIAVIEYPFSTICMDASHDFTSSVIPEIRKYCEKELGVYIDKVLLVACFLSENIPEPGRVIFDSSVKLCVFKDKSGKHLAALLLGGEISRK